MLQNRPHNKGQIMRKVFIDTGAHKATSVKNFKDNYPHSEEYEIFSFEANKNLEKHFKKHPDVNLQIALVWKEDGVKTFYNAGTRGSSIYKSKAFLKSKKHLKDNELHWPDSKVKKENVKTVNLDRWIKENFNKEDEIILKLNIQGAEYEVLEHILEKGSYQYINKLYIEWFCAKTKEITIERHIHLIEYLAYVELIPYFWSCASQDFEKIEVNKANIIRTKEEYQEFIQYENRYNIVCQKFKKIQNKQKKCSC